LEKYFQNIFERYFILCFENTLKYFAHHCVLLLPMRMRRIRLWVCNTIASVDSYECKPTGTELKIKRGNWLMFNCTFSTNRIYRAGNLKKKKQDG